VEKVSQPKPPEEREEMKLVEEGSFFQPQVQRDQVPFPKQPAPNGSKIMRAGSIESFASELGSGNNLAGSFCMPSYGSGEFEIEKLFKSSGFGLNLPAPEHSTPNAKEIFGDSGHGMKRNEALMHFSAMSMSGMSGGDERNSFFNFTSDKGVIETEDLINSR
jgi:hypothetical protein